MSHYVSINVIYYIDVHSLKMEIQIYINNHIIYNCFLSLFIEKYHHLQIEYFQNKFSWDSHIRDEIIWDIRKTAIRKFPLYQQIKLAKIIINWTHINKCHSESHHNIYKCPNCHLIDNT